MAEASGLWPEASCCSCGSGEDSNSPCGRDTWWWPVRPTTTYHGVSNTSILSRVKASESITESLWPRCDQGRPARTNIRSIQSLS